ncbi:MAG: nucleotidyltransferase family protein [Clostridia bacterium]|nr:nucleotidyltransferase family protein [Clostridia bacterium]
MLDLLKASLWGTESAIASREDYSEMKAHAIAALPANVLPWTSMDPELRTEWKKTIMQQLISYNQYLYEQENLPITFPYVILKGTSAAKYYPHPEYRKMGDIDIMTRREDYENACSELIKYGFVEHINKEEEDFGRHRGFSKNGVEVEVHAFFALLNEPKQAEYLDDLIIENITPSHELPDLVNGLVLLEHIAQHMEGGLGLRQIIDWMMFVDKCLSDEKEWSNFRMMAQRIGLEKLTEVVTRMCEMFLGLEEHTWCRNVDEKSCKGLMDFVLSCGNFGIKLVDKIGPGANVLSYARTPFAFIHLLQERGLVNWKTAQKHAVLRPFAWLYQIGRYLNKGLGRKNAISELKGEYVAAKERVALFDALGVKQSSKGLAVYRNGKYQKTYKMP